MTPRIYIIDNQHVTTQHNEHRGDWSAYLTERMTVCAHAPTEVEALIELRKKIAATKKDEVTA